MDESLIKLIMITKIFYRIIVNVMKMFENINSKLHIEAEICSDAVNRHDMEDMARTGCY